MFKTSYSNFLRALYQKLHPKYNRPNNKSAIALKCSYAHQNKIHACAGMKDMKFVIPGVDPESRSLIQLWQTMQKEKSLPTGYRSTGFCQ